MHIKEDALRGQVRSKVRSTSRLLGLNPNLGRVMLDRGQVQNVYRVGRPPRSSEVTGQDKFQAALMELKLGEDNAHGKH